MRYGSESGEYVRTLKKVLKRDHLADVQGHAQYINQGTLVFSFRREKLKMWNWYPDRADTEAWIQLY